MQSRRKLTAARSEVEARIVDAYWPLHRSVLIVIGLYFTYVTVAHATDSRDIPLGLLIGSAVWTSLLCLALLVLRLRGRFSDPRSVELSMVALSASMLFYVATYQFVHFEPVKLVYFPLVAVAASLSATTNRSVVGMVAVIMASMLAVVARFGPETLGPHIFVTVATSVTTIGFGLFLRGVITREVAARLSADESAAKSMVIAEENSRLAQVDMLTELPNRRGFFERVQGELDNVDGPDFALGVLDLDGFKAVNDVFGHTMGDRVLCEVAARLGRPGSLPVWAARLGGDEFGLLIAGKPSDEALIGFARELAHKIEQPFRLGATSVRLSGSLGLARARQGDSIEAVLDRADYAAYEAKGRHRGSAVIFSLDHETRIGAERQLERAVLEADFDREIYPVFQPIVDGISGETVGYEALARWRHPEMGDIGPASFVPMAERLGLAPRITEAMARKVIDIAERLPTSQRVSLNLSAHDLASSESMARLAELLSAASRPCRLDFEVTETAVMRDIEEANTALLKLAAHGAHIALDDFGTGHSSLSRVQRMPLHSIKVDRSFVAGLGEDRASEAIVRTTLDLCRNLGVRCVLEGVETAAQRDRLLALGARYFQGYLFGRPVGVDKLADLRPARLSA